MADLVTMLATQTGIDPETIRKGLGALLQFLKGHLGSDAFDRVMATVPGAAEMLAAFESQKGSAGGLFGAVTSLAGSLLGGSKAGEGAHLLSMLSQAGLDAHQIEAFLPRVFEHVQGILPSDLLEQVRAFVPSAAPSSGSATP